VVLHGQQKKIALTPQDYIDIQQLVASEFHQQTGRVWRGRADFSRSRTRATRPRTRLVTSS
jgi:hypothetical protein